MKKRLEITFFGKVQGVAFRHFSSVIADKIGIMGWVRNNSDGSVSLIVEGEEDGLKYFIDELKTKNIAAEVESEEIKESPYIGEFQDFKIIE